MTLRIPVPVALVVSSAFSVLSMCQSRAASADDYQLCLAHRTLHSDSATLVWNKPPSAVRGTIYEVLRDGQVIGTSGATHFTVRPLNPNTEYHFAVRADGTTSAALAVRTLPAERGVSVLDQGAVGDGKTLNTKALQAAIDACPEGGIVRIPAGVFLTGALYLKSDMTLEIEKDGVLKGTTHPEDYLPFNLNRFEGWEMETHASLLNAGKLDRHGPCNIRNLSIRGEGTISGGGVKLHEAILAKYEKPLDGIRARGRLILIMNAENVEVSGLTLEETSCWTLHYIYSKNVSLHGLNIRSRVFNGDGIDPDSSVNSLIFNCTSDTGDDCIAIKSGKNPEGVVVNKPTENVRVFDCRFNGGHGISIGSEMSGGVRNILIEDCVAGNLIHGMQIKGTKERGGFVENVTVRDCDLRMITIYSSVPYNNDGEPAPVPPFFRNFRYENIDMTKGDTSKPMIVVTGFEAEGHLASDVVFKDIHLPAGAGIEVDRAQNVTFTNVLASDGRKPTYKITRSRHMVKQSR